MTVTSIQSMSVSVGGAGRRVCNPRLYEHAQRVVWCDPVELKFPGPLCVKGGWVVVMGGETGGVGGGVARVRQWPISCAYMVCVVCGL